MEQLQEIIKTTNLRKLYSYINTNISVLDWRELIQQRKTLILELFNSCFDESLLIGGQALQKLLTKIYNDLCKNDKKNVEQFHTSLKQYVNIFIDDYIESVKLNQNSYHINFSQQINRILGEVNVESIQYMIEYIVNNDVNFINQIHKVWAVSSLLKVAKTEQQISVDDQGIVFKNGTKLNLEIQIVQQWMFNINRNIQFEAFQIFALNSRKVGKPTQIELDSILMFIKHAIKTSYPNFKKNYLAKLKFFFERLRTSYSKDLKLIESGKSKTPQIIQPVVVFVQQVLQILYSQLIPDCCYEISNPCLEILKMVYLYMGTPEKLEPKKGEFYQKTLFLYNYCYQQAYDANMIEQLIVQCSSNWESSRTLAYEILLLLPSELTFFTEEKVKQIFATACQLIGNPIIKWYESGSLLLSWLLKKYSQILFPNNGNSQIQFLNHFSNQLQAKFEQFKQVFSNDIVKLQQTLIHGYIATFWVILQRNDLNIIEDKEQLKQFFIQLLELLKNIIEFATQVSSENICTWIIDDKTTTSLPYQVDCRGHFYQTEFVQNIQKILSGNTLIESLDDKNTDSGTENILVVSFFLITKESGVFFQELAKFIDTMKDPSLIPNNLLKRITYQFFHALLNIKHLGSIDRIAQGLYELCKTMGNSQNPQLPGLVNELIDKLVEAFDQNQLKNVFRRSAGLPHLVCCLLRSCPQKDKQTHRVAQILMKFARDGQLEMRIHALNVIRKLFMEAWLRSDLEPFISQAYMLAIDGFSYDDWSVRNSSLMLFSALASRTLGKNTQNVEQIAEKLTLLEFFNKSPDLVEYFNKKINDYSDQQLYPSLYPIALILSRLAPMEGKFIRKVYTEVQKHDLFEKKQIDLLLPSLIGCLKNKNYLGRIIVSRSILPFLSFSQIVQYTIDLLNKLPDTETIKKNHNNAHGILLVCYQLIKDYYTIKRETLNAYEPDQIQELEEHESKLVELIGNKIFIIENIKCPPVLSVFYQLLIIMVKNQQANFKNIADITRNIIKNEYLNKETFSISQDMGQSILRKKQLSFISKFDSLCDDNSFIIECTGLIIKKYLSNQNLLEIDDLEVLQLSFKFLNDAIKQKKVDNELPKLTYQLLNIAQTPYFSQCARQALQFLLIVSKHQIIEHCITTLQLVNQRFINDSAVVSCVIKLYGHVMLADKNQLDQFVQMCELYSHSNNIDDLRVAVIKSITIAMPQLKKMNTLKLSLIYLKLLQDEIPEIRNQMSELICIHLFGNSDNKCTQLLNNEYILHHFYDLVFQQQIEKQQKLTIEILISQLMDSDFYMIKRQNHLSQRIFQYEKSNKYVSELKNRKLAYDFLIKCVNNGYLTQEQVIQGLNEYEEKHKNTVLMEFRLSEKLIQDYQQNLTKRDDYIYENLCRLVIYESLHKKFNEKYQPYELSEIYKVKAFEFSFEQFN